MKYTYRIMPFSERQRILVYIVLRIPIIEQTLQRVNSQYTVPLLDVLIVLGAMVKIAL